MKLHFLTLAHAEDLAEQFLWSFSIEEVFLVRARARMRNPARSTRRRRAPAVIEESRERLRPGARQDRGVTLTAKPFASAALMADTARSNTPGDRPTCHGAPRSPSRWTEKEEIRRRLEQMQLSYSRSSAFVQSETNFFLATSPFTNLADLAVDQRLAAGDRHHGCAALVGGIEALFDGEPPIENWIGINRSCRNRRKGQIATKQRL